MKRTNNVFVLACGVAATALVSGCSNGNSTASSELPRIEVKPYEQLAGGESLAKVNDAEITSKMLDERINRSTFQNASEVTLEKKKEFLDELIANEVLYQEAKAKGYAEHPRVKMMMVSLLQRDAIGNGLDNQAVGEAETKAYYDSHHDEFVIPEKVRARRILILAGADKAASKQKAQEIRDRAAANPNDFGKIALETSEGPEKIRQGELGYFASAGRPGLDPKIVSTAFSLKNGEVSQVFENAEGWNVVKVENRAPRTERSYEQVKKSIERKLLTDRRKAMLDNFVAELKNKAKVAVSDEKLAAYTPEIQPKQAFNPQMVQQLQNMGVPGNHPTIRVPGKGAQAAGDDGHGH